MRVSLNVVVVSIESVSPKEAGGGVSTGGWGIDSREGEQEDFSEKTLVA